MSCTLSSPPKAFAAVDEPARLYGAVRRRHSMSNRRNCAALCSVSLRSARELARSLIRRPAEPFSFERRQIRRANHDLEEKYTDSEVFEDTKQGIVFFYLHGLVHVTVHMYYYHLSKFLEFTTWHQCPMWPSIFTFSLFL